MENKTISVAIDGPSGAGKSTIAKMSAQKFGFIYVDTGAIYRTVGLYVSRAGVSPRDAVKVQALLPGIRSEMRYDDGVQKMILNGEDVSDEIRLPEISRYASDVSAHAAVREFLLEMQRAMAEKHSVVMDGRDIGTVVLPDADVKIFLTASAEERAKRRHLELMEKGVRSTYDEVYSDMILRDSNDSSRAIAPLRPADDCVIIDTTQLGLAQSFEKVAELIEKAVRT
jgi:cytidylate kinase